VAEREGAPVTAADPEAAGRDRLAEELERQRQYFQSLLEISPVAIVTTDLDTKVTSWNPEAERLFGYASDEAVGRRVDDLIASSDELRTEAAAFVSETMRTGRFRTVTRRTRKDGTLVDVDLLAVTVSVDSEPTGYYVLYHDISELQRQKRYYESLVEVSPTAIATVDIDANVTSWNPAAARLFGYTAAEAIERSIDDVVAQDARFQSEAVDLTQRGLAGEEVNLVTQRPRRDGSLVDVEVRAAPIVVGGEVVGMFVIYHDISELQRQKRYYESLLESSPSAIVTIDLDATVTSWNPAAERLFGYTRDEAVGQNIDELVAGRGDLRKEAEDMNRRGATEGRAHLVSRRMRKDGSLVDVHIVGAPIVVSGEQVGLYAIYSDVSELQRARREAEAATEAKSAFLATMSHEIRTPMNAVIGMTELLLGTRLDPEQRSFADVIRTSGEALFSVINDILDFSKIEAGRLDLELHPFDLRECVESAMELVAPTASEKALDLAYLLDPTAPEALVGDAARLRQILLNLLNNAVKFTEWGEVVMTIDAEPLDQGDGPGTRYRVHFAVRDTGIGIPPERLETLFESFTQLDASTTRRYGGTGLGLAISRRLTEAMGGMIWVESRVGEGSTFHFTVDASEAPSPVRSYEAETVALLQGRRVLIVDDNATNRHIARAYVESWGMVALDTGSPREAVEWVHRGDPFDAAILDMHMPELDGLAVAEEIRRYRDAERLPLILLTSLGRREEASGGILFAAHLTKPIRPSQLYDALLDALGEGVSAAPLGGAEEAPTHAASSGLQILVAEDNAVNQRLALLMLDKLGYRGDVVSNGAEALEALERRRYDVVLMDVQMPELDGLEATRRIHERWASARPHIIAVTAGAMNEERERCLAAGMDDYLSKPIRIEELSAALGALRQPEAERTSRPPPASPEQSRTSALDAAALARLRETLGDAATAEIVGTFLAEGPPLLSVLHLAVERGDADGLRRAAHTLKSNAATFGAAALAELCRELEAIGEAGTVAGTAELLARVDAEHERVRSDLEVQSGIQ
jgi:PAS domain S-box-containing protein